MKIDVSNEILSFKDIPAEAKAADKTILLLRHSMRRSLNEGSDPSLTPEGAAYAVECGRFLAGMPETCFGASDRKRAVETAEGLMQGGGFPATEIIRYPQVRDTVIFTRPENLDIAVANHTVAQLLKEYFLTGKAEGMIDLEKSSRALLGFLTQTEFPRPCTILTTHDIICATLLLPHAVYPFKMDDWCGYIQGGALFCINGQWKLHYTVPDAENRPKYALFI